MDLGLWDTWVVYLKANNLCVKLLALRKGLLLAWNMGFRRVICEVDCSKVVKLALAHGLSFHSYAVVIVVIQKLLAKNWSCVL